MDIFSFKDKIRVLPVVHGSGHFTRIVRDRMLSSKCDCLAVALPPEYQPSVEQGLDLLPTISLSCLEEENGSVTYVPVDPCQPVIMALRIARQEGIPRHFIDWSTLSFEPRSINFPDTFSLRGLSLEKFCTAMLLTLKRPVPDSQPEKRARWMAYQLHKLEIDHSRILLVCSILDWPWIKE
ncbi:uncharacterized protein METZ01_LOCUS381974, partial [marine metagenome]